MNNPTTVEQVSNSDLRGAISGMKAGQTPETLQQFVRELFRGTYILPLQVQDDGSNGIKLVVVRTPEGQTALPVFTDSSAYLQFNPSGMSCTIMEFRQVLPALFRSGVEELFLNPGDATAVRVPKEQLQRIVQQIQGQRPVAQQPR